MPDALDDQAPLDGELNETQQAVCRDIAARIAYWREESDLTDLEMLAVIAAVFGDEMRWQVEEERRINGIVRDALMEEAADDEDDEKWKHPD